LVNHVLFHIYELNNESLDNLKKIDVVEKPLEDEENAGDFTHLCDKQHGNQENDVVFTLFVIGRQMGCISLISS
jgi:hypothetical protein